MVDFPSQESNITPNYECIGGDMPARVEHSIDDASRIIFVSIVGSIKDEVEATALAAQLKN